MSLLTRTYLLVLFVFTLGGSNFLLASTKDSAFIPNDTAAIDKRQPDKASQEDVYNSDDWDYVTEEEDNNHEETFWDRLLDDIMDSIFDDIDDYDPYGNKSKSSEVNWWSLFFIIIGIALVVFFIVKATGAGGNTLFKGKSKQKADVDATLEDVDIHAIDYDKQIYDAKARNDYRLAVRLWFLRSLKEMTDKKLITWKIDKTNSDYYYELSGTKYQKDFGKISNLYDYVWYGEFKIDALRFGEAERDLQVFHGSVTQAEEKK